VGEIEAPRAVGAWGCGRVKPGPIWRGSWLFCLGARELREMRELEGTEGVWGRRDDATVVQGVRADLSGVGVPGVSSEAAGG